MNLPQKGFARLDFDDPLVAWLTYRGEMVSSGAAHAQAMSFWLADKLKQGLTSLTGELAVDLARTEAVSRLQGFFLFADRDSADAAATRWGGTFATGELVEVAIAPGARWSRHDAEWITDGIAFDDPDARDRYLAGDARGSRPIWELVVDGRGFILGTSGRQRAYEVVKRAWPASLALLELARLGVELGSDLGLIVAMLHGTTEEARVDYAMNFVDATNAEFLERFAAFNGPRNTIDLRPDSDLVVPDLRDRGFVLATVSGE